MYDDTRGKGSREPSTAEHAVEKAGTRLRRWCREWWVTLRYGSRLTRAGRALRRNMRDGADAYVEVERP